MTTQGPRRGGTDLLDPPAAGNTAVQTDDYPLAAFIAPAGGDLWAAVARQGVLLLEAYRVAPFAEQARAVLVDGRQSAWAAHGGLAGFGMPQRYALWADRVGGLLRVTPLPQVGLIGFFEDGVAMRPCARRALAQCNLLGRQSAEAWERFEQRRGALGAGLIAATLASAQGLERARALFESCMMEAGEADQIADACVAGPPSIWRPTVRRMAL